MRLVALMVLGIVLMQCERLFEPRLALLVFLAGCAITGIAFNRMVLRREANSVERRPWIPIVFMTVIAVMGAGQGWKLLSRHTTLPTFDSLEKFVRFCGIYFMVLSVAISVIWVATRSFRERVKHKKN